MAKFTSIQNATDRQTPWVKICGVRDVASAKSIAELAPDAIGLNFYPPSSRFVSHETAARICETLPSQVAAVGVFVNASVPEILQTVSETGIAAIQLHGDEPIETVAELREHLTEVAIIRAWRVGDEGLASLAKYLEHAEQGNALPDALLVDAKVAGAYGGTGHVAPWNLLRAYDPAWPPLILAGGLTPENVAAAVREVHPWGVDTAGGVESAPGVKDIARAASFLEAAHAVSNV